MLRIKDKPKTKATQKVPFDKPQQVQKLGVEMLITLNTTSRDLLIGPEVDEDLCILVTKIKPHFFFNPTYSAPESLNNPNDDSIIEICYQNYLGNDKKLVLEDTDHIMRTAIDYLNNGRPRKKRAKKDADKS